MKEKTPINEIQNFLKIDTPKLWAETANIRLPELLIDHANCELKAASTALSFIYRYSSRDDLPGERAADGGGVFQHQKSFLRHR